MIHHNAITGEYSSNYWSICRWKESRSLFLSGGFCLAQLAIPSAVDCSEFKASESVTSALTSHIIQQQYNYIDATVFANQRQAKVDIIALRQQKASLVSQITWFLPANLQQILSYPVRKEQHLGCLFSQSKNMGLRYTKGLIVMLCAYVIILPTVL